MTFVHQWLEKLQLEQINNDQGRVYKVPTGACYPSITALLSKSQSDGLKQWKEAVGENAATEIANRAARRGTKIHEICESYILNKPVEIKNFIIKDTWSRFKPLIDRINNVKLLEARIYSDLYKIAGTVDCVAEFDGVLSIIDFKTANSPKYESMIDNYFIQTYAYKCMFEERYGIEIEKLVVLISVDHDKPQVFESTDFGKWDAKLRELLTQG